MTRTERLGRRAANAALAAALALATAGCGPEPVTGTSGTPGTTSAFEVISTAAPAADAALPAHDIEPMSPGTQRWAEVDPGTGHVGVPFEVRTEPGTGRVERIDRTSQRTLVRDAVGAVLLAEQRDLDDGAVTRFVPPLLLAPPTAIAAQPWESESGVETRRGNAIDREGGRARRTASIGAAERIRTPMGTMDTLRVDSVITMKVPFASMRRETSTWVRPGHGPVAVRSDERILVMGIVPRDRRELRVRLPEGGR
jgi:hypothetical protein